MNKKIDRIGKSAALITSLILFALMLNIWVLKADATEQRETMPVSQILPHQHLSVEPGWAERVYGILIKSTKQGKAVPAAEMGHDLQAVNRSGKAAAFVLLDELMVVDKKGRIIASADSCPHYNLPIISGSLFYIDEKQKMLVDRGSQNALELLSEIRKRKELWPLLSEIKVNDSEVIAYFGFGRMLPVIFGEGGWEQKIDNLIAYQRQLGGSDLEKLAAYLDLRIKDRIVVKKNV